VGERRGRASLPLRTEQRHFPGFSSTGVLSGATIDQAGQPSSVRSFIYPGTDNRAYLLVTTDSFSAVRVTTAGGLPLVTNSRITNDVTVKKIIDEVTVEGTVSLTIGGTPFDPLYVFVTDPIP